MNNKIPSNFDLPKLVEILYYPKLHFVSILKLAKRGKVRNTYLANIEAEIVKVKVL